VAVRLSLLAGFAGLLDMLHVGCLYSPCLRILYARTYLFISGYFDVLVVCAYGCMRVCLVQCYCCVCFCVCVCVCVHVLLFWDTLGLLILLSLDPLPGLFGCSGLKAHAW